jgi:hypothetical protein
LAWWVFLNKKYMGSQEVTDIRHNNLISKIKDHMGVLETSKLRSQDFLEVTDQNPKLDADNFCKKCN